jgi:hypothetical protein
MTATEYREYTLHCDGPSCRARYKSVRGPVPRAEVRRAAARDGWTHVREAGRPVSTDQDFCPNHKPPEGTDGH